MSFVTKEICIGVPHSQYPIEEMTQTRYYAGWYEGSSFRTSRAFVDYSESLDYCAGLSRSIRRNGSVGIYRMDVSFKKVD